MGRQMTNDELCTRRAMLVRHYLNLAQTNSRIESDSSKYVAINLLHEALETTLITISEITSAAIKKASTIENYIEKIEDRLGSPLPLRTAVLRFNRARVSAKHALTLPSERDLAGFFASIPEFCNNLFLEIGKIDLDSVNLVELIQDEELTSFLISAQQHVTNDEPHAALIEVRKCFFLKFEKQFDIQAFDGKNDFEKYGMLDERSSCRAPSYAKSNRYIKDHVKSPLDYIVLDHSYLDNQCLKAGINTNDFWNIWRLTPSLRRRSDNGWYVRIEFRPPIEKERDHARYALEKMIEILLIDQVNSSNAKYRENNGLWLINARPGTIIYSKCTRTSEVTKVVEGEGAFLTTSSAEPSFDDDSFFWSVMHLRKGGPFYGGFLHKDDFDGELHPYDPALLDSPLKNH